ncbi:MAG: hypothetical protein KA368_01295 [Acidobacteria bacterium]|nr:hypothetical protein [Acidobacteriota bacterium]
MNCQEFEQTVAELAADKLMSARARVAALAHAAACESCGDRLAAEQALNHELSEFANSTRNQQASVRLRQSLRAEFEAQARHVKNAADPPVSKAIQEPERKPFFNWQWSWGLAAAAAIVLVVAVSIWRGQQTSKDKMNLAGASPTPTATPVAPMALPETVAPQTNVAANAEDRKATGKTVKSKKLPQRRQQPVQNYESNLASNYIPLSYAAGSATPGESLVVRVDVPRATLIAMGLPLSAEHGNGMVKADLRVGIDGVPLAIRLVQ